MSSIVNEFRIFHILPENIRQNIRCFYIHCYDYAFCVTNDNKVYVLGKDLPRILGYRLDSKQYTLIDELCDQNIDEFYYFRKYTSLLTSPENDPDPKVVFTLSRDYEVFGGGRNNHGQLARGYVSDDDVYLKPAKIEFFENKKIIDICCGDSHCLALCDHGHVYGWGHNNNKQLIDLNEIHILKPTLIDERVKYIHCYQDQSIIVTMESKVKILGFLNSNVKLLVESLDNINRLYLNLNNLFILYNDGLYECVNEEGNKCERVEFEQDQLARSVFLMSPRRIIIQKYNHLIVIDMVALKTTSLEKYFEKYMNPFVYCLFEFQITYKTIHLIENGIYVRKYATNESHSCDQDNLFEPIYSNIEEFHRNYSKSYVTPTLKKFKPFSLPASFESKVKYYHQLENYTSLYYSAIFVMFDNKVYAFGDNRNGILGLGHNKRANDYSLIDELCDQNIEEFFSGNGCIFARSANNQIFGWGHNCCGGLTKEYPPHTNYYLKPFKFEFFADKNIIIIRSGYYHFMALSTDGCLYGWGDNRYGQVDCHSSDKLIIHPIKIDLGQARIKFVSCNQNLTCAITEYGNAYYWGKVDQDDNSTSMRKIEFDDVTKIYFNSTYSFIQKTPENISKYRPELLTNTFITILSKNQLYIIDKQDESNTPTLICDKATGLVCVSKKRTLYEESFVIFYIKDAIYEYDHSKRQITNTNYVNFYEYCLHKHKTIVETIHISRDGYLMRHKMRVNDSCLQSDNYLTKSYENIFKRKYENSFIEEQIIGRGGFGSVFKGKDLDNQYFAIKRIEINGDLNDTLKEIDIMSKLSHDYVVNYISSWTEGKVIDKSLVNFVYIQMELCEQNLEKLIEDINRITDDKYYSIKYFIRSKLLYELIECLNHLHSSTPPIIHRDLKPQNVLVTDGTNGRFLKLCDFGLSKIFESLHNTRMRGTVGFMAPEVFFSNTYDLRSDIYSLGMLASDIFQIKVDQANIFEPISNEEIKEFSKTNSKPKLIEIIGSMLSLKREERPDCEKLLRGSHEWIMNKRIILSDKHLAKFFEIVGEDNSTIHKFLNNKLGIKK